MAAQEAASAYLLVILLSLLTLCNVVIVRFAGSFAQLLAGIATTAFVPIAVTVFFLYRRNSPAESRMVRNWRWQQFMATFAPAMAVYGYAMFKQRRTPIWTLLGVPGASSGTFGRFIFLDLAHLVDAARCNASVKPGKIVCDRLGRAFNQNPLLVEATRPLLRHVELQRLGFVLAACFITGVALLAATRPSAHLLAIPMLFSPSVALGIERGQPDLFVWLLAAPGVLLLSRSRVGLNAIGVTLVAAAAVLKVFPLLLLLPFLVLPGAKRRLLSAGGVVVACLYWLVSREMLITMLESTQRGRYLSYGLTTILPHALTDGRQQAFAAAIVVAIVAGGAYLAHKSPHSLEVSDEAVAAAFACFYLGSFVAGANWSYRLVLALVLIGRLRLPGPRRTVFRLDDEVLRLDTLLILTVVPLLWLTPVHLAAFWQLAVALVSAAILIVVTARVWRYRPGREPSW